MTRVKNTMKDGESPCSCSFEATYQQRRILGWVGPEAEEASIFVVQYDLRVPYQGERCGLWFKLGAEGPDVTKRGNTKR